MEWYQYDIRELTREEYAFWYSQMNREKQSRIERFRFEEDKYRSVAGEMLVRKAIVSWCDIPLNRIVLSVTSAGKPFAPGLPVEFNISHSENMVVCAIDDRPIGIDIEKICPMDLAAAQHICTHEELIFLFGHEPAACEFAYTDEKCLLKRFFELWTAKEAVGKQSGFVDLKRDVRNCSVQMHFINDYVMAVCQEGQTEILCS